MTPPRGRTRIDKLVERLIESEAFSTWEKARAFALNRAKQLNHDVAIVKTKELGRTVFVVRLASRNDSDYAKAEIIRPDDAQVARVESVVEALLAEGEANRLLQMVDQLWDDLHSALSDVKETQKDLGEFDISEEDAKTIVGHAAGILGDAKRAREDAAKLRAAVRKAYQGS